MKYNPHLKLWWSDFLQDYTSTPGSVLISFETPNGYINLTFKQMDELSPSSKLYKRVKDIIQLAEMVK